MDDGKTGAALTGQIIGAALKVHSKLGPGVLESAYEACLAYELRTRSLRVSVQLPLPIPYEGVRLEVGYRVDLLVEESVVVELKAVERVLPIHRAQLLSYLRLGGYPVRLLINFRVSRLSDGIERIANGA